MSSSSEELKNVLENGDVEKAEILHTNFLEQERNNRNNRNIEIDLFNHNLSISSICSGGHVNSLIWLGITRDNVEKKNVYQCLLFALQNEKIEVCEWFRENFPLHDWMDENYFFYENEPLFSLAHNLLRAAIGYGKLESVIWLFQHFEFFKNYISRHQFDCYRDRDSDILWAFKGRHFDIVCFFLTHEDYPKEEFKRLMNKIENKEDKKKMLELFEPIGMFTKAVKM